MSGSRSKAKRRAQRERPAYLANANYALRSADAVLSVDLSAVPLTLVNQFAVGWMRAAFEQSRVIANLTAAGKGHVAAPNRRTLWELSLRLHWLADMPQSKREPAANAMLAHERSTVAKTDKHMRDMGVESDIDIAAMNDFILNVSEDPKVTQEAKDLTAAVYATELNNAVIYRLWREDSTYAHATGSLAGYYAPAGYATVGDGTPPVIDPNLDAHRLITMFIVVTTGYILTGEGVPSELASAPATAFHMVR